MGASLSLRAMARLGACLSLLGISRLGSSMSVLDSVSLGAALSLRAFSRIGSAMSVLDFAHLGSTLSVRSFLRFGSILSVQDEIYAPKIYFENSSNTITWSTANEAIEGYVNSVRGLSIHSTGGTLHGTWISDEQLSTSDRRFKRSIMPLSQALSGMLAHKHRDKAETNRNHQTSRKRSESITWLLRELRPVSFTFKNAVESKGVRYGFVAQEVQQVLPSMVRKTSGDHLALLQQDFIALLVLAAQVMQDQLHKHEEVFQRLQRETNVRPALVISSSRSDVDELRWEMKDLVGRLESRLDKMEQMLLANMMRPQGDAGIHGHKAAGRSTVTLHQKA